MSLEALPPSLTLSGFTSEHFPLTLGPEDDSFSSFTPNKTYLLVKKKALIDIHDMLEIF